MTCIKCGIEDAKLCLKCAYESRINICPRQISKSDSKIGISMFYTRENKKSINVLEKVRQFLKVHKTDVEFNHNNVKEYLGWADHAGNEYVKLCLEYLICCGEVERTNYDTNREKHDDVEQLSGKGHKYCITNKSQCEHMIFTTDNKKRKCKCPDNQYTKLTPTSGYSD